MGFLWRVLSLIEYMEDLITVNVKTPRYCHGVLCPGEVIDFYFSQIDQNEYFFYKGCTGFWRRFMFLVILFFNAIRFDYIAVIWHRGAEVQSCLLQTTHLTVRILGPLKKDHVNECASRYSQYLETWYVKGRGCQWTSSHRWLRIYWSKTLSLWLCAIQLFFSEFVLLQYWTLK